MSKQNIIRDTEIKNKLTVTRGERGGNNGAKSVKGLQQQLLGHMDKTKGGWNQGRDRGWLGLRAEMGGKGRKLYLNNNKI